MKRAYVTVKGELVKVDDVEFLNIEEDPYGRDLMTFKYKGEEYKALVILK